VNDGQHTLGRWPHDVAVRTPSRIAVDDGTDRINYADLDNRADALARTLRAAGCRPGDRIATLTGNSAAHLVLFFACARARLVLVPLSWRWPRGRSPNNSRTPSRPCWWCSPRTPHWPPRHWPG
jgi:fatty-acyl-CoA synthase